MADARFQVPPDEYDKVYFSSLIRDLRQLVTSLMTPSITTFGKIIFIPPPTGIPTSGAGQPLGTVYLDVDTLKMVIAGTGYATGFDLDMALGTVTATG